MKEQKLMKCAKCLYEWQPRKEPSQVKECPNCKSRKWRGNITKLDYEASPEEYRQRLEEIVRQKKQEVRKNG